MKNVSVIATALPVALLISGCAGVSKSMSYNHIKHVVIEDPSLPHAFWVFDDRQSHKMLVNTAPGAAAAQGVGRGLTLGIADTSTPHQHFEKAAQVHLDRTNPLCTVDRSERVLAPTNYEILYSCREPESPSSSS